MRVGPFEFVPRLVPTLAAAVMIALLLSLGRWQTMRAAEKQTRQDLFESRMQAAPLALGGAPASADELLYRRVVASGRYVPDAQIYIDNRLHAGRAGFHVITPLKIDGADAAVLVNRGWIARTAAYPKAPQVAVPEGTVRVAGLATRPPARVLELSAQTVTGDVWQNLSIERYRERTGRPVLPVVVLAAPPAPGLAAVEERPNAGIEKHREYALTWFSLAVTVLVIWIALNVRRLS